MRIWRGRNIRKALGVTLFEIMVVVSLSSMVLLGASKIMTRTTRTFKKGSDILNTQLILDSIIERIRSDIRSMAELGACEPEKLVCKIPAKGAGATLKDVEYLFDRSSRTLTREDKGESRKTNFQAVGKIKNLHFQWLKNEFSDPDKPDSGYLSLVIELESDERGEGRETTIPFICHFSPKCLTDGFTQFLMK
jgi:hypothetical protein